MPAGKSISLEDYNCAVNPAEVEKLEKPSTSKHKACKRQRKRKDSTSASSEEEEKDGQIPLSSDDSIVSEISDGDLQGVEDTSDGEHEQSDGINGSNYGEHLEMKGVDGNIPENGQCRLSLQENSYYLTEFKVFSTNSKYYVGKLLRVFDDDNIEMSFLRSCRKENCRFVYPQAGDQCIVARTDIRRLLPEPTVDRRGGLHFLKSELEPYLDRLA